MYSAEGTGKTIEKAIENALFELKATREDVDIKILNEGGLFKKAKVIVTISEDAREKYEKRNTKKTEEKTQKEIEKTQKTEAKAEEKVEKKELKKEEKVEKKELKTEDDEDDDEDVEVEKPAKVVDPEEFLKSFFEKAGKTVNIAVTEDDNYKTYHVDGEDLGEMIGHRGECFYAISRLLAAVVGKQDKKLLIDIGGYREKRKESLTQLALRTASKVAKTGRYQKLEPMNPSDRRIVHTALQSDDRVTTLSKGTEPHRYVIVFPKEYDER